MTTRWSALVSGAGIVLALALAPSITRAQGADKTKPVVVMETSLGSIRIELDSERAPKSVENFLRYVKADFYAGTIFHRVISDFVVQGGGYTASLRQKAALFPPIALEVKGTSKNLRGTVAMARTDEANSATCQFFINVEDNPSLDYDPSQPGPNGFAVFGRVVAGMDVVDKMRAVPVSPGAISEAVPNTPVVIKAVRTDEAGR
ncbi:MAG: peptidylprolyl isomerase [Candidatus Eisenbacteria bacterium]|nr:peptidylprolyl isomerase [Candidatus Eisenbacteria bacterium]